MKSPIFPSGIVKACNYLKPEKYLDITTRDGFIFRYYDVPEDILDEFVNADNPGNFYMKIIRSRFKRMLRSFDS
ncbi:MAG: KTSC domain-containing protein [Bacteroidales bacterium]|nr:KTSC domain-containing protein [Bacteroidales bacterium]MCF8403157.1 KTSC domain-containing protein [Bacteroidales bacterium]